MNLDIPNDVECKYIQWTLLNMHETFDITTVAGDF